MYYDDIYMCPQRLSPCAMCFLCIASPCPTALLRLTIFLFFNRSPSANGGAQKKQDNGEDQAAVRKEW